jgi:tripartite-type tricarboxylate transporter receptor subunit TctC
VPGAKVVDGIAEMVTDSISRANVRGRGGENAMPAGRIRVVRQSRTVQSMPGGGTMPRRVGKLLALLVVGATCLLLVTPTGRCAEYPNRTIKIVVPADAGSGEDAEARGIAPFLQQHLGVSVLIENQPGAGGRIALERFQKTAPDGYTVICNNIPKSVIYERTFKVEFTTKDFTPIFSWSLSYNMLVVPGESWKTLDEFLNAARAKAVAGGLSAIGGVTQLAALAAAEAFGIHANWVPFDGVAGSLTALAGKHIDFSVIGTSATAIPLIQAGKIRPLVLFNDTRDPLFSDVPTARELGFTVPAVTTVRGIQAPPKTPTAIVKLLEQACFRAIKEPGYIEWAKKRNVALTPWTSEEYYNWIVKEAYPTVDKYEGLLSKAEK